MDFLNLRPKAPVYIARGRKMRLCLRYSITLAVQPDTRLTAKIVVKRKIGGSKYILIFMERGGLREDNTSVSNAAAVFPFSQVCALICITCAATAAGLTMGFVSIDPLEMAIKQRSGTQGW